MWTDSEWVLHENRYYPVFHYPDLQFFSGQIMAVERPRRQLRRPPPPHFGGKAEHAPGLHPGQVNPFGNTEGFYPLPPSHPDFALPVIREDPSFM